MKRSIFSVILFGLIANLSCQKMKETSPLYGVNGKIIGQAGEYYYMIDLGSIYRPEPNTAIFVAAIIQKDGTQFEWVVEADLNNGYFIRGIGPYFFLSWPSDIVVKAINIIKETPYEPLTSDQELMHPLGDFSEDERTEYIYLQVGDPDFRRNLLTSVKYWSMKRAVEGREVK